jgi:hypothetical protein
VYEGNVRPFASVSAAAVSAEEEKDDSSSGIV